MPQNPLNSILTQPPVLAAQSLLGWTVFTIDEATGQHVGGVIIETEAYLSENDAAAHNARGKTSANSSLFSRAGTLYMHSMRGHWLMDFVTEGAYIPGSVLIRALMPSLGLDIMAVRRGVSDARALCSGPGKLTKSLAIDRTLNGQNILDPECPLRIIKPSQLIPNTEIASSARIGISKNADARLRFYIKGSNFTSR